MALEQKLSLRLSQRLVMTPSLQQAIKLLQMTRLELEGVLSQELEENPVLETSEDDEGDGDEDGVAEAPVEEGADDRTESAEGSTEGVEGTEGAEAPPEKAEDDDASAMDEIDLDAYFNDYLETGDYSGSTQETREAVPLENILSREPDLYDHLSWQLQMMDLPPLRREIAELIIGNLEPDGFLTASIEELQLLGATPDEVDAFRAGVAGESPAPEPRTPESGTPESGTPESPTPEPDDDAAALAPASSEPSSELPPHEPPGYPRAEVEAALAVVQGFDPPGVAARDLRESLLLQLRAGGLEDSLTYQLVDEHWDRVLKRQFVAIAKAIGLPLSDLEEPAEIIRGLETRPGRSHGGQRAQYVEPDVAVLKVGDDYVIQVNDDGMPRLRVSGAYRKMLQKLRREGRQSEAQQFIKEKMRSALWLIKSLDQRQRTIYKVADSIVRQQRRFFDGGIEHLRPMVLRDVAEDIGMHESTVSRVVSNKYIHTPRGMLPLKFFFHSGIDRDYGEDISSLSVKRKIKQTVNAEDPKQPLSDAALMRRLKSEGIQIARRTVAKYRDELGIPSSTDRKQVF